MKKIFLTLAAVLLLSGCADNAKPKRLPAQGQNSVSAVMQAKMAEQTSLTTTTETVTEETTVTAITEVTTQALKKEPVSETSTAAVKPVTEQTVQASTAPRSAESPQPVSQSSETVDLSVMNANIVYSEVFAMMTEPQKYMGKTVKMTGVCNRATNIETGADYYACIITDATACCSQGIEFKLPEGESYPQMGTDITVTGTFGTYTEDSIEYCVLYDAKLLS